MKISIKILLFILISNISFSQQPININLKAFINGSTVDELISDPLSVEMCIGDTLVLTISPDYINSLEATGAGYSQNNTNVTSKWDWSTGQQFLATNTVQFIASSSFGFTSRITLTDINLYTYVSDINIKIGTTPIFSGLIATPEIACFNEQVTLFGGFDAINSTLFGGVTPPSQIMISGQTAGLTYLPDGNNNSYSTTININGFPPSQTLSTSCGIESICLDMEHSYIGDVKATITCPNGTVATLFDGDAVSNTDYFLGEPIDEHLSMVQPGIGYNYCFSDAATYSFLQVCATTIIPGTTTAFTPLPAGSIASRTINAGSYKPVNNLLTTLNNCPLNGAWTITVTDDATLDDGYIFSWEINFAACNYGPSSTYQNYPVSGSYTNATPFITSTNSTTVLIPQNLGNNPYNFNTVDDFGCSYDTIINVMVHNIDVIEFDTVCSATYTMVGNTSTMAGTWSHYNSPSTPTFASSTDINTTVTLGSPGIYHLVYSSAAPCATKDTFHLSYFGYEPFLLNAPFFVCPGVPKTFTIGNAAQFDSVDWNLGILPNDHLFSNVLSPNTYTIDGYGKNSCHYDTTFTITTQAPVVLTYTNNVCWDSLEMSGNTGPGLIGQWSYIGPSTGSSATFRAIDSLNTGVKLSPDYGTWYLIFTEPVCNDDDTLTFTSTPGAYVNVNDLELCLGNTITIESVILYPEFITSTLWNTGATTPTIDISAGGTYTVTVTNACQTSTDSSIVDGHICDIEMPNVFSPNDDGINDLYFINGDKEIFKEFNISIVNRWGNKIKVYNDPFGTWDGTNSNGEKVPQGVYFYSVKAVTLQDEELTKQGFIHVIYENK